MKRRTTKHSQRTLIQRLPWQVFLGLAILCPVFFWFGVDHFHLPDSSHSRLMWQLDQQLHNTYFLIGIGWFTSILALLSAFFSWRRSQSRTRLLNRQRDLVTLQSMSWQEFEQLVGECFKRQGYKVSETGQGGADGGVDLLLRRGREQILVQCKQWKTSSVGAPVVREMFGLMTHYRADRVKIVSCGHFTKEAFRFAQDKPVDLIGGSTLLRMIKEVQN